MRALRDVGEGEELKLSQIDLLQPKESRQRNLVELRGFECIYTRVRAMQGWVGSSLMLGLFEIAATRLTCSGSCHAALEPRFPMFQRLLSVF